MSPRAQARPPARRLTALFLVLALGFVSIAVRLTMLQLGDAPQYVAMARDQRVRHVALPATRGAIYDRDGNELAISLPAKAVFADPSMVEDPQSTAASLSPLLGIPPEQLGEQLAAGGRFVYLARRITPEVATRIERLELPGIGFLDESRRSYPAKTLASQVLGFVGLDGGGLAGLESQHDELLAGVPGEMVVERDPTGRRIPHGEGHLRSPVAGSDLLLTIDRRLQFRAQQALVRAVKANGAKGGTVVIMEPGTGEILAMATYPWFDANRPQDAPADALRNRAITDVYEPGSVNKVITASAAMEEGIVDVHEVFDVPDSLQVGPKLFHDAHPHAPMKMQLADILAESSNVGAIKIAQRVGKTTMQRYLKRFGFGRRTQVGFPGEGEGILPPTDEWWETGIGTIPIGQGIAVTPLQIAAVYATIANGGVWVQPRLVRGVVDAEGTVKDAPTPKRRRVVSADTARAMTQMLAYAVETGTGTEAQIPGYWVAGKTGTARKPENGTYGTKYIASFIGFAPAEDPDLVVAAILDEPTTIYGGVAAAPLFQEVTRFALASRHVPTASPLPDPPSAREP